MRRRIVLHLIDTGGPGGAETVVEQLVEHLDGERWRSVVVLPHRGWLLSALTRTRVTDVVVQPGSGSFDLRLFSRLVSVARSRNVDVIHTHLFGSAVYGSAVARLLRLPVVSTIHGTVDLAFADKWFGIKKQLIRRRRSRFVAVTESLRALMLQRLGVAPERTEVILNGIDVGRFAPGQACDLRRRFGWANDDIVVGAVGNVRRPKGYMILLQAAALLRERCPSCRFAIVGDTTAEPGLYRELLDRRRELALEEHVAFTGFRDDVQTVLNNLDIYVMSSTKEGLPLAILQAMAARLPIVATRCGGPQEVLTHEQDALLVEVGDPGALANGIENLAKNRGRAARLAEKAYEAVRTRYTLERMVQEYENLYELSLGETAKRMRA